MYSPITVISALHHAVLGNNSTSTKILLDANAPVDGTSRAGKTPLNIAQEQRNKYILQLLTFAQERQMQSTLSQILLHNPVSSLIVCLILIPLPSLSLLCVEGQLVANVPRSVSLLLALRTIGGLL